MTATATHCPYCALQCAMDLSPVETTSVEADAAASASPAASLTVAGRSFPTNRGGLCKKGWTSAELLVYPNTAAM
ncbi:hypothetical protein [Cryobacterium sp. Y82]|uniref:hypothetical protein n=1 Tax=Cryobacterium sp. Y82 TaxID=2045017 RepID=UPI000CE32AE2